MIQFLPALLSALGSSGAAAAGSAAAAAPAAMGSTAGLLSAAGTGASALGSAAGASAGAGGGLVGGLQGLFGSGAGASNLPGLLGDLGASAAGQPGLFGGKYARVGQAMQDLGGAIAGDPVREEAQRETPRVGMPGLSSGMGARPRLSTFAPSFQRPQIAPPVAYADVSHLMGNR